MAKFNTQYYQGNDQYSDGDIEERILRIVQEKSSWETSGDRSFPVLYHLSQVRENILSWYDFRKGASVLEIGAGPGAITGLLCRKCHKVTSVELSMRRARINYERHRDCENLTLMAGNLNDMQFEEQFDYVVLNGVFEYAGSFTQGADPYAAFLRRCAGYLKEDGRLLIAIENRLGLKYFAGAPEDHTDNYMEGLKDYPENPAVHTFSKQEWETLCDRCGLSWRRFYYPYPDYKFPGEIFTQGTLRAGSFGKNAWNFNPRRLELFSEQAMGETLCREGVMDRFMNSFLIEAGRKAARPSGLEPEIVYAKISSDRDPSFRIQTVIRQYPDGSKEVVKSPLTKEAAAHLERMHERESEEEFRLSQSGAKPCASLLRGRRMEDGSLVYPFLPGKSLAEMITRDAASIRGACDYLMELILAGKTSEEERPDAEVFTRLFGKARLGTAESLPETAKPLSGTVRGYKALVCPANIDLIFDNIFPQQDGDRIIDGEWIVDTPVPAQFLLWRAVNELYSSRRELEQILPRDQLLKEYGISQEAGQVFWKWASHFEKEYVRANRLGAFAMPVRKADLAALQWTGQEIRLTATLYLDRGNGWREEDAVHVDTSIEKGRYDVTFEIDCPSTVRALRFDPLEGCPCICDLHSEEAVLMPMNASARTRGKAVFLTLDPSYRLKCRRIPDRLRITGRVRTKDPGWALDRSQELLMRSGLKQAAALTRRTGIRLMSIFRDRSTDHEWRSV